MTNTKRFTVVSQGPEGQYIEAHSNSEARARMVIARQVWPGVTMTSTRRFQISQITTARAVLEVEVEGLRNGNTVCAFLATVIDRAPRANS
jgi:hypothetical protein